MYQHSDFYCKNNKKSYLYFFFLFCSNKNKNFWACDRVENKMKTKSEENTAWALGNTANGLLTCDWALSPSSPSLQGAGVLLSTHSSLRVGPCASHNAGGMAGTTAVTLLRFQESESAESGGMTGQVGHSVHPCSFKNGTKYYSTTGVLQG